MEVNQTNTLLTLFEGSLKVSELPKMPKYVSTKRSPMILPVYED